MYSKALGPNSIIYSAGVGEDTSFDELLISKFNCMIHAFDPTPKSIDYIHNRRQLQNLDGRFKLYEWALSAKDGSAKFYLPTNQDHVSASLIEGESRKGDTVEVQCKSLLSIMKALNHEAIDLLKIDIEGSEFEIIDYILNNNIQIGQLLVEVHPTFFSDGFERTKKSLERLEDYGMKIYAVSRLAREYSLINRSVLNIQTD
ncbi:MAG: FkbM family methyltransferase [Phycisphaerales bacterium]